ncbi:Urocanate reductase [anaerobic digester metagenome]
MLKIESGPYYAIPQWPSVHHTMGGLAITEKTEVLDIWNKVIPGLYAAGEVTGGVHGTNRLGSNAIPDAAVHGWIAGEVAVKGTVPAFVPKQ